MSISIMSAVWQHAEQSGSALLMLLALADYANDDGVCWPKVGTLAQKTRLSQRQSIRLLMKLEADGEIAINRRAAHGMKINSVYQLNATYLRYDKMAQRTDTDVTTRSDIGVTYDPPKNHQKKNFSQKPLPSGQKDVITR